MIVRDREVFEILDHVHNMLHDVSQRIGTLTEGVIKIMATQVELTAQIQAATDKLTKIGSETKSLLKKIDDLMAVIANGPVSPELQAAADALSAQADVVDALVPDAPTP